MEESNFHTRGEIGHAGARPGSAGRKCRATRLLKRRLLESKTAGSTIGDDGSGEIPFAVPGVPYEPPDLEMVRAIGRRLRAVREKAYVFARGSGGLSRRDSASASISRYCSASSAPRLSKPRWHSGCYPSGTTKCRSNLVRPARSRLGQVVAARQRHQRSARIVGNGTSSRLARR